MRYYFNLFNYFMNRTRCRESCSLRETAPEITDVRAARPHMRQVLRLASWASSVRSCDSSSAS